MDSLSLNRFFLPKDIWTMIFLLAIYESNDINLPLIVSICRICKAWRNTLTAYIPHIKRDFYARRTRLLMQFKNPDEYHQEALQPLIDLTLKAVTTKSGFLNRFFFRKTFYANVALFVNHIKKVKSQLNPLRLLLVIALLKKQSNHDENLAKALLEFPEVSLMESQKITECYPSITTLLNKLNSKKILSLNDIQGLYQQIVVETEFTYFQLIALSNPEIEKIINKIKILKIQAESKKLPLISQPNDINLLFLSNVGKTLKQYRQKLIELIEHEIDLPNYWPDLCERYPDIFGSRDEMGKNIALHFMPQGKPVYIRLF